MRVLVLTPRSAAGVDYTKIFLRGYVALWAPGCLALAERDFVIPGFFAADLIDAGMLLSGRPGVGGRDEPWRYSYAFHLLGDT